MLLPLAPKRDRADQAGVGQFVELSALQAEEPTNVVVTAEFGQDAGSVPGLKWCRSAGLFGPAIALSGVRQIPEFVAYVLHARLSKSQVQAAYYAPKMAGIGDFLRELAFSNWRKLAEMPCSVP